MKRPWFPLYVADFITDTTHLTAEETGAYLMLLMHHWERRALPNDDRLLCRLARVHPPRWQRIWGVLRQYFVPQGTGSWVNTRMVQEIIKSEELSNKRKAAAQQKHNKSTMDDEQLHTHARAGLSSQSHGRISPPSEAHVKMENFDASRWPRDYREKFWAKYPHKVGKAAALAKLERAAKTGRVTFENLMAGLDRYVHKTDDRPWCNPATWIHQDRWLDQPAAPAERNGAHDGQRHGRRIFGAVADDLIKQFEANDAANRETDLRHAAGENVVRRLPPRQPA